MRKLFQNFKKSESGASLVEYAVALIVVTIVGGAGVITIAGDAGGLATNAAATTTLAETCSADPTAVGC